MIFQIKTPFFFYKKSIISIILLPFSIIFATIVLIVYKCGKYKRKLLKTKVICIGNFIAGGSGKTPVCAEIATQLINKGYKCCVLTVGYGRQNKTDYIIRKNNPEKLTANIVGDEPLILSQICDVFVVKKRHLVSSQIEDYDFVICDDDLWDKNLFYDIKIAIISQKYGFGNGAILPAGPLRTFDWIAKTFSDWVIVIQDDILATKLNNNELISYNYVDAKKVSKYLAYFNNKNRLISGKLETVKDIDYNIKYLAFAGLANNDKFFDMLIHLKYNIIQTEYYPDHYLYTKKDIDILRKKALTKDLILLTTEKDFVKIKHLIGNFPIQVMPIKININSEDLIRIIND